MFYSFAVEFKEDFVTMHQLLCKEGGRHHEFFLLYYHFNFLFLTQVIFGNKQFTFPQSFSQSW